VFAASNSRDWDYPTWSERLSSHYLRFDNNTNVTNNLMHPLAGAAYYGLSRANGLSVGEAVLYSQVSSAIWEWGLEWREKPSINDMVSTTASGTAAGEFLVQLAAYLNSATQGSGFWHEFLAGTLGFPVWMHRELDDEAPIAPGTPRDRWGMSTDFHHRFTLDLHRTWADDTLERTHALVGGEIDLRLVHLRGYRQAQELSGPFAEGNFTRGRMRLLYDRDGLRDAAVAFDALLAGWYEQWAQPQVGLLAGVGTGLDFADRETLGASDQLSILHFVGPTFGLWWNHPPFELDLTLSVHQDLAPIRSLAWPEVRRSYPDDVFKSTLDTRYQYHLGFSTEVALELRLGPLLVTGEGFWGHYRSIEGFDRFEELITRQVFGSESLLWGRASLALEPPGQLVRFFIANDFYRHSSTLAGIDASSDERRLTAGGGIAF
jgi:hypothetical protein